MRAALLALAVAPLMALAACDIPVGSVPDGGACAAAPDYFVSTVWPAYLAATSCGTGGCHAFNDGHGYFRLRVPETPAPAAGTPLAQWPLGWRENYLASIQLLDCHAPLQSRLLTVPEGDGNLHPPGPVVRDRAAAAAAIAAWVAGGTPGGAP